MIPLPRCFFSLFVLFLACIRDTIEVLAGRQVRGQSGRVLIPLIVQQGVVGSRWAVHVVDEM